MAPDAARGVETDTLGTVAARRMHQFIRDDAVLEDFLVMVQVVDKGIPFVLSYQS